MDYSFPTSWNNLMQTISAGANDWGGLHPIVVHIPIALLLIAPLFIVLALFTQKSAKSFLVSALILMLIGTASIYLAVSTGEEASELIKNPSPEIYETLETHYHSAEDNRLQFSVLSAIFLAYLLFYPILLKKFKPRTHQFWLILFVLAYSYHLVLLLNTAHQGGKLVHHHEITSKLFTNVYQSKENPSQ